MPELEGGGSPLWLPLPGSARLLLALCAAAIAGHLAVRAWVAGPRVHLDAETLAATRLAAPWVERVEPVVHYRTVPGTAPAGVAFASRAAGRAQGYGGPINLLVATDEQGRVLHLELLQHRETPSYLEDLDAFLGRCVGSNLLQGFRLQLRSAGAEPGLGEGGQAVDAMTGATVTSQAVLAALETSGRRLAEPVFGTAYNSNGETGAGDRRWFALAASFLFLLPILWRAGRRARLVWLAAQAAVTGGYLGVQFSTVQTLALLRFETDWNLLGWTGLLGGGVVLLTGALGPVYCGYLCPAGAVQELLAALGRRLNVTRTLPVAVDRRARFAKYALLSAVILGALGVGSEAVEGLDLLRSVWDPNRGLWATALLALVALGSVITVRFGCRYLCPAGAFLNLANRFAPARRLLPRKRYRACDLGVRSRRELDCIHCGRCRLGETVATASPLQSRVIRAAIAVALGALVVGTQPFPFGGEPRASLLTRVEPVDAQLIRLKLAAGKLSEEPAQYWHVIRP